jgi:flagellar FliJ protein
VNRRAAVFETLVRLAERQADSAGARLSRLIAAATDDRGKLGVLERYRVEYRARMASSIADGVDARALQNYRVFLAKLDEAIRMQAGVVNQRDHDVDRGRHALTAARRRVKTYVTVTERMVAERAAGERHREQVLFDELALQRQRRITRDD